MARRHPAAVRRDSRRQHQEENESGHEQDTVSARMFSTADFERGTNPHLPFYGGKLAWFGQHRRTKTSPTPGETLVNMEVDG